MKIDQIELHDGLMKDMAVDYKDKTIVIKVDYYEAQSSPSRISALITFEGVESFSEVCNFDALERHVSAGHINDWVPAKESGTTYIDLIGGCIAICAKSVRFDFGE